MQKVTVLLGLLASSALGGIVFRDIRPQSYFPNKKL